MKSEIHGKLLGLKKTDIQLLERLYRRRIPREQAITIDLANELAALSGRLNRRLGLYIDRAGHVRQVILGSHHHLEVPEPGPVRAGDGRLRGIRLVETVLDQARNGRGPEISQNDLVDLLHFRLDCLVEVSVSPSGTARALRMAHLLPPNQEGRRYEQTDSIRPERLPPDFDTMVAALEQEFAASAPRVRDVKDRERALVVALLDREGPGEDEALAELSELARSAGAAVVDRVAIRIRRVDPRSYLGRGSAEEVELRAVRAGADIILFDRELSPVQARNLEHDLRFRIIDRTALILDIFAQRARSTDGKHQVELAQLKYQLPRIAELRGTLSRVRGGIGSNRGVGETKAALTRRHLRERIAQLERRIAQLSERRRQQRKQRARSQARVVSLVGYTNAGKSTLFNTLTGSDSLAEDRLFATLDPTARRLYLPGESRPTILTDTVGFIRDLPVDLVNAFRATLEGLSEAELLLHVADASNPAVLEQVEAVKRTLEDLELDSKPVLLLFNKSDKVVADDFIPIAARHDGRLISALASDDQQRLRRMIGEALNGSSDPDRSALAIG
jgi:GTP-binding protein HflX